MQPRCINKTVIIDAIDQLIAGFISWQEHLFDGDNWHEASRIRLLQCRSQFLGQVRSACMRCNITTMSQGDWDLLDAIEAIVDIPFNVVDPPVARKAKDDWDQVVDTTPLSKGRLDYVIEDFARVDEIASGLDLKDDGEWRDFWDSIREAVGQITGEAQAIKARLLPQPATLKSETPAASEEFRAMEGLTWKELTITFISNDAVRISARGKTKRIHYSDMGFTDNRKGGMPTTRWAFLREIATKGGSISWNTELDIKHRATAVAQIRDINKTLKTFFGIKDNPFPNYKAKKAYQPDFKLQSDLQPTTFADNHNQQQSEAAQDD